MELQAQNQVMDVANTLGNRMWTPSHQDEQARQEVVYQPPVQEDDGLEEI